MDEAIRVEGLTKNFGSLRVLRGIDCTVSPSEVVCVIGPSGSGKSTFLRCLNGLEEASGGKVLIHGVSVHDNHTDIDTLRPELAAGLRELDASGRLTCSAVFELARRVKTTPLKVSEAANILGLKIRSCQLGCF